MWSKRKDRPNLLQCYAACLGVFVFMEVTIVGIIANGLVENLLKMEMIEAFIAAMLSG